MRRDFCKSLPDRKVAVFSSGGLGQAQKPQDLYWMQWIRLNWRRRHRYTFSSARGWKQIIKGTPRGWQSSNALKRTSTGGPCGWTSPSDRFFSAGISQYSLQLEDWESVYVLGYPISQKQMAARKIFLNERYFNNQACFLLSAAWVVEVPKTVPTFEKTFEIEYSSSYSIVQTDCTETDRKASQFFL